MANEKKSMGCRTLILIATLVLMFGSWESIEAQTRPNIILVNLDDADTELFELPYSEGLFPNIMGLAKDGISFTNFHVTTPLCGPSRASLYRAQYAHNTGIQVNRPGERNANGYAGGFRYYREQGYFENDLSTWMKDAGYRTMMVGKFLHSNVERWKPPGWDDFRHYFGALYYGGRKFTNEDVPSGSTKLLPPDLYRTTAETLDAVELIQAHVARNNQQPFFLNLNPLGPHKAAVSNPVMIERRMESWWLLMQQPFSRAYNEFDIGDKATPFTELPRFNNTQIAQHNFHFRERALATRSVDEMIGTIRQTLQDLGIEHNTYLFLTSDNGFLLGHHRIQGKGFHYDRTSRVPCMVVGPNVPAGIEANHLIGHIDLGPTIVQLAGGSTPDFVDGRSFSGLLNATGLQQQPSFRAGLLIENWASINFEAETQFPTAHNTVRLPDATYTEWANGEREFYDLRVDPEQLENRIDQLPISQQQLYSFWLRVLKNPELPPAVRFSNIYEFNQLVVKQSPLSGLAEAWANVAEVRLAVRDRESGAYWNGEQWQTAFTQVDAQLDQRDRQLVNWRLDAMPTTPSASGRFAVWAWAYDDEGNYGSPQAAFFEYDREAPVLEISPDNPADFDASGNVTLIGTARDNLQATQVVGLVHDRSRNLYWTGDGFLPAPIEIEINVSSNGNWNWGAQLPAGNYDFTGIAKDASGNRSSATSFQFSVR